MQRGYNSKPADLYEKNIAYSETKLAVNYIFGEYVHDYSRFDAHPLELDIHPVLAALDVRVSKLIEQQIQLQALQAKDGIPTTEEFSIVELPGSLK